jgi:hypothetical protein
MNEIIIKCPKCQTEIPINEQINSQKSLFRRIINLLDNYLTIEYRLVYNGLAYDK